MKSDKSSRRVGFDWIKWFRRELVVMITVYTFFANVVLANPMGAQVVSGNVSMNTQGKTLNITNSPNSIINWQSFSIKSDETTRFIQQNAASTVLNRVQGQDPSAILGSLMSNGRVLLINPNGIIFGQGARVDVNGFIASTLNISNQDFLSGKYNFNAGTTAGNISNQGTITTPEGGMVYLIAPNIENNGIITSPNGDVLLAAGHSVQLVDSLNPEIAVVVSAPADKALNLGQIVARGGRVGIYGSSINLKGIVNANSAVLGENGEIFFKAKNDIALEAGSVTTADGISGGKIKIQSEEGTATVAGQVSATGSAGQGGAIGIFGRNVGLTGNASVDASGKTGGGEVLIGGERQGKNPEVQNAQTAFIDKDTEIRADATDNGDGGKVIVWSDEATRFYGHIFARGGQNGGNGGFVETSGHTLKIGDDARVNTSAPKGNVGEWLIDPVDITIAAAGGDVTGAAIATALQSNNVTLDTTGAGVCTGVACGALGGTNGDITINDNINTAGDLGATRTLKLIAERDILLKGGKKIDATLGGNTRALHVIFNADSNTDNSGGVTLEYGSAIKTNGGNIVMGGGACTAAGCSAPAYGRGAAGTGGITIDDNDWGPISLLSGNGAIWMWGSAPTAGGAGIHLKNATINSGTGGSVYLQGAGVYDAGNLQDGNGFGLFVKRSTIIGGSSGMTLDGTAADTSLDPFAVPPVAIGFTGTASAYTTNSGTLTVNANSPAGGLYVGTNWTDDLLGHATLQSGNIVINYTGTGTGGLPNIKNPAGNLTVNSLSIGLPITDGGNAQTVSGTTSIAANSGPVALGAGVGSTFTTGTLTVSNGLGIGVINTGALTLGALDAGAGPINIATRTGDLTLGGAISTTDNTASAILLNAGSDTAAGTATGGNIIVSGGSLSMGAGGRATLYSGSVAGSTGLTAHIGSGSGNFRYNSDESATNFSTVLGAGSNAVYRQRPTVTVTANDDSKTYDGAAYSGGNGFATGGFVNGDTAASLGGVLTYGGTSQGASNVGSYLITPGGYTSGLGYALSFSSGALQINPAAVTATVTANSFNKTYGTTYSFTGREFTSTGLIGGDTIGSVTLTSAGAPATAAAGSYSIIPTNATGGTFNPVNYTITYVNGILNVTKAPLIVTANNAGRTYNGLAYSGGNGVAYSGFVNNETMSVLGGSLIYGGTSQGAVNAGAYTITPSGLTATNYQIGYVNGALSIDRAPLTVTANNAGKTYNGVAYSGGNGVTYSGFVNNETAFVLGGSPSYGGTSQGAVNVGAYTITPSGLTSPNYQIGYVNGVLTIDRATLTVMANNVNRTYNGLAYSGGNGLTYSGFVNGETASVLGGSPSYGGASQGAVNVGAYTIVPSGLTSLNYQIGYVNGALTIDRATLTVTANNADKTYNGAAYSGGNGVAYSGFVNGETSLILGGSPSYGGTSQGAVNAGSYTITPSGLTATNYQISYINGVLTIDRVPLTVTASNANKTYRALLTFTGREFTSAGLLGNDTIGSVSLTSTGAPATALVGNYSIIPSNATGGTFNPANYTLTYQNGTLTVNAEALQPVVSPTVIGAMNNSNGATITPLASTSTIMSSGTSGDSGSSDNDKDKNKGGSQTSKDGNSGTKKQTVQYCN